MKITVETSIHAPVEKAWRAATTPEAIMAWNRANDDWHCPSADVDLRVGGRMSSRMEAKDGSMGFDFAATYTVIQEPTLLEYKLDDDRVVRLELQPHGDGTHVKQTFDAEADNDPDFQRMGWQAILDHFAAYVANQQ